MITELLVEDTVGRRALGCTYLLDNNPLAELRKIKNMTLAQSHEAQRDLLTEPDYKRGTMGVEERLYTYDVCNELNQ